MAKILVLHGPNLNLLGSREPEIYGQTTLSDINTKLKSSTSHEIECLQSNAEHILIDRIQKALDDGTCFIIFNPAAFTHTSIALRDTLLAVSIPFIEVHLSKVNEREAFRQTNYFSDIAVDVISGLGAESYYKALQAAEHYIQNNEGTL